MSCATRLLFTGVYARCDALHVQFPGPLASCSPVCSRSALCRVCDVLGHLAPVHRCARSACCVACAVSWATWLLFTGVHARRVLLCVRCPGPLGSCLTLCTLGVLCCVCGVLDHLAPVNQCSPSVRCVACVVSWPTWLLFTGAYARCVVLRVQCPWPPGSCSPCARLACSVTCALSWGTWLMFTGVHARRVLLRVRCPGPLGSRSAVCTLGVLCCVCGVLGHFAPVHRCARSVRCLACAVFWTTWVLFTGVQARRVVLRARCPRPHGSC